ncbi:isochorismate synthase DhbC [Bacillus ginsengihumi]|uniref:isochorismate synthase n=1 Tax=Heyndrickxia ginsengihumi TaxID=363870 RepID=A0A0A6VCR2_9BACI|nr:isochorismate synthase DhbC [Heyndrickxia ginsengihumi]KHD85361.1 isochorismate synthase [Heyndrickxia ginsengihumi]MBE6184626.1 isochorismate synthase DhbC [Bacillus sp. (in: firmicutes)]NEY20602.1 isochorismate synthase DhbC [Heyndrickxia ginsengihumi]
MSNTTRNKTAKEIIHEYEIDSSFFLSTPQRTLLTKGIVTKYPDDDLNNGTGQMLEQIRKMLSNAKLQGMNDPIVVGAIPFDYTKSLQLFVPKEVEKLGPLSFVEEIRKEDLSKIKYEMTPVPERKEYGEYVAKALKKITNHELSKIVLARSLHVKADKKIAIHKLIQSLVAQNSNGYTFAVNLPQSGLRERKRTLLGASPELLVSKSGSYVCSNPLAGSAPRSKDPKEDQRRAEQLLHSSKDRYEHKFVVDAVAQTLKPFCTNLEVPTEPSLIQTETMWHLSTEIRGQLANPSTTALELGLALHPTPAVCGAPTNLAKEAIQEIEAFNRDYYSGMVGWSDADGNGEWIVTIRCAEVEDDLLKLYAGAGIVAGSKADSELAETSAKLRTMLLSMGISSEY